MTFGNAHQHHSVLLEYPNNKRYNPKPIGNWATPWRDSFAANFKILNSKHDIFPQHKFTP